MPRAWAGGAGHPHDQGTDAAGLEGEGASVVTDDVNIWRWNDISRDELGEVFLKKSRPCAYLDNEMQALDTTQKLHKTQLRPCRPDGSVLAYNLLIGHGPPSVMQ
jgi:hypothetical protein